LTKKILLGDAATSPAPTALCVGRPQTCWNSGVARRGKMRLQHTYTSVCLNEIGFLWPLKHHCKRYKEGGANFSMLQTI